MPMHRIAGLAAAAAFLIALPAGAQAQQQVFQLEARGGVAVPTGDLNDLQNPGASFGAKLAYMITPRIGLRADGDIGFLRGDELEDTDGTFFDGPDLTVYHYTGGLQFDLAPERARWSLIVNGGAGATTFDSEQFEVQPGITQEFSETYFTANGGVQLGYDVTSRINAFLGSQVYVIFADQQDTQVFADLSPTAQAFETVVNVPIHLGFNVSMPLRRR